MELGKDVNRERYDETNRPLSSSDFLEAGQIPTEFRLHRLDVRRPYPRFRSYTMRMKDELVADLEGLKQEHGL